MNKAMLLVSFGTSYEETRAKTIDVIEAKVRAAFPDCAHYCAWTSKRIINKVRAERGERHDTVEEALARMEADGVRDLVVATTCLMEGHEMAKIRAAVERWSAERQCPTCIAEPLLASSEDRAVLARCLSDEFSFVGDSDAVMMMGHGSRDASNSVYVQIQEELHKLGRTNFFVATVEGDLTFDDAWPAVRETGPGRVYLTPLMIVAGDHACNDLAGDDEDSWASLIRARGVEVQPVLRGLGEYAGVQQMVCDHANDALTLREVSLRG